jgi:hypothetical protein
MPKPLHVLRSSPYYKELAAFVESDEESLKLSTSLNADDRDTVKEICNIFDLKFSVLIEGRDKQCLIEKRPDADQDESAPLRNDTEIEELKDRITNLEILLGLCQKRIRSEQNKSCGHKPATQIIYPCAHIVCSDCALSKKNCLICNEAIELSMEIVN